TLPGKGLSETQAGYGSNGPMAPVLSTDADARMEKETPRLPVRGATVADTEEVPPAAKAVSGFDAADDPETLWGKVIDAVALKKPSVAPNMAKCRLSKVKDNTLEIEVNGNGFITKMVTKNLATVTQICSDFFGRDMQIKLCKKADVPAGNPKELPKNGQKKQEALSHPLVSDAIEIFNGTLVDVKKL
ncbi:MAG: hypothetical protein JRE58_14905, partial [Deltaproteobacteria bacterium]|nr:hypothetical protein [Deltaproteobacteria bacterium]